MEKIEKYNLISFCNLENKNEYYTKENLFKIMLYLDPE
jgi:hypothetical protein